MERNELLIIMKMKNIKTKKKKLNNLSEWYRSEGFYSRLVHYGYISIKPYFKKGSCLELGCADGSMTRKIINDFEKVVAVDGSSKYCDIIKKIININHFKVICSLFEEFQPEGLYDTIIMAHVLEHLEDPILILKRVKNWLNEDGVLIIIVPCADSIHRQVAVKMGLLKRVNELNDYDIKLGHRRVYTWDTLLDDIKKADLKIEHMGGIFFKPLTNKQIEEWFNEKIMDGFFELGKEFPKISSEIYAICKKE